MGKIYAENFDREDLRLLYEHARGRRYIIETGTGISTTALGRAAAECGGTVYTVDLCPPSESERIPNVVYYTGWSVNYEDFVFPGDPDWLEPSYKNQLDLKVILGERELMKGESGVLHRILHEHGEHPDFYFSDAGEHCGIAEWRIMRDRMCPGSIFAAHDIWHPKSIKNCQVRETIENDQEHWRILALTNSRQGLLIAERLA